MIFTNEANASPRTLPLPTPNFSGGYQLTVKTLSNSDHVIYSEGHLLRLDSDLSELMASVNMTGIWFLPQLIGILRQKMGSKYFQTITSLFTA